MIEEKIIKRIFETIELKENIERVLNKYGCETSLAKDVKRVLEKYEQNIKLSKQESRKSEYELILGSLGSIDKNKQNENGLNKMLREVSEGKYNELIKNRSPKEV